MTDKEKIRAEIERRIDVINNRENKIPADKATLVQLTKLLSFIDSMQEEPVSEDLEEAAKTYAKKKSHGYEPCNIVETFMAGAKWQRQQDMKFGYITALQGEKQFARYILEMIANGWHIEAIKTACNDKMKEEEQ